MVYTGSKPDFITIESLSFSANHETPSWPKLSYGFVTADFVLWIALNRGTGSGFLRVQYVHQGLVSGTYEYDHVHELFVPVISTMHTNWLFCI